LRFAVLSFVLFFGISSNKEEHFWDMRIDSLILKKTKSHSDRQSGRSQAQCSLLGCEQIIFSVTAVKPLEDLIPLILGYSSPSFE